MSCVRTRVCALVLAGALVAPGIVEAVKGGLGAATRLKKAAKPAAAAAAAKEAKPPRKGTKNGRIKAEAYALLKKVPFPYAKETKGGSLGCAQVVSTALKAAGVVPKVDLSVRGVNGMLRERGWKEVSPPPWNDGDIVSWSTYDSNGDGKKDPNTHIGIIVKENGTTFAINNSSSKKRPVKANLATYGKPVTKVLRMVGA